MFGGIGVEVDFICSYVVKEGVFIGFGGSFVLGINEGVYGIGQVCVFCSVI